MSDLEARAKAKAIDCGLKVDWGSAPACVREHYIKLVEKEAQTKSPAESRA